MTIDHKYKIYRDGNYLGELPNVTSDFGYNHQIKTAFTQLDITVGKSVDVAPLSVDPLETESGQPLETEGGNILTIERQPDIVGDSNPMNLIRNDNDVLVYEYSDRFPNGQLVFTGYISKWGARIGSTDDISVTVLNKSKDLNHYLTPGSTPHTLDISQTTSDGDGYGFWSTRTYGQSFRTGAGTINISKLTLRHWQTSQTRTYTVKIWPSFAALQAGGTPLGTASGSVPPGGFTLYENEYTFATPVALSPSTDYFFSINVDGGSVSGDSNTWGNFDSNNAGPYANGTLYSLTGGGPTGNEDMWFKTYHKAPSTAIDYNDMDVSDMLDDVMDEYIDGGGSVSKMPGGFLLTNVVTDYRFNLNTTLEAIQVVDKLGPSDWFWYVDPATLELYYQPPASYAQHIMIKSKHYEFLDVEATKEDVATVGFFTGGDKGTGQNVYVTLEGETDGNRRGLVRLNDPKVKGATGEATGAILLQNYLDQHSGEQYITSLKVLASTYDLSLFKMGQMVGFANNGNFLDRLLLQIVGINRQKYHSTLSLGMLRPREPARVEEIRRDLDGALTVDNPDTPS